MSRIYSEAGKVLVWVSGAAGDSDELLAFCVILFVFGLRNLYIFFPWVNHQRYSTSFLNMRPCNKTLARAVNAIKFIDYWASRVTAKRAPFGG